MTLLKIALVAVLVIGYAVPAKAAGDFSTVQIRGAKSADISNVVFGPVQQEDTLWKIAKDYRNSPDYDGPKPPSLYPVMYAIYLKNSQAFIDNNVNHLRNDVMLEMPSSSFINSLDLAESERKIESDESKWGYQDSTKIKTVTRDTQSTAQNVSDEQISPPTNTALKDADKPVNTPTTQAVSDVINQTENVASQQQIINEIRAQYAVSLETIQILLAENKKLASQVNDVAQRVNTLAAQVNGDVQNQLEEQAELQAHLFALLDNGAADEPEVETSPWVEDVKALMSEPLVVIGAVSLTVLVSLIIFGLWLFRRKQPEDVLDNDELSRVDDTEELDDVSESLLEEIVENEATEPSATEIDLNALIDDIPEPTEAPTTVEEPEEEFAGDLDGLIVPESTDAQINEDELRAQIEDIDFTPGDGELDQSELDALFADSGLDDSNIFDESPEDSTQESQKDSVNDSPEVSEVIDETDIDNLLDEAQAESAAVDEDDIDGLLDETQPESAVVDEDDIDGLLDEAQAESAVVDEDDIDSLLDEAQAESAAVDEDDIDSLLDEAQAESAVVDEDDIDSLLDEAQAESELEANEALSELEQRPEMNESAIPENLDIDEYKPLDDEAITTLDQEIETQSQNIDKDVDNLLNELEQIEMMESMLGTDTPDEDTLDDDAELRSGQALDDNDALADELLAELGATDEDTLATPVLDANDALADELLDELTVTDEMDHLDDPVISDDDDDFLTELNLDEVLEEPSNTSVQEALTDELLDELLGEPLGETPSTEHVDSGDAESPEVEQSAAIVDDVPELDDLDAWLTEDSDKQVLDEIENVDFDDLLDSLDKDLESADESNEITDLSDDILGDLSFDSFAENSFDESGKQSTEDSNKASVVDTDITESVDAEIPEYLDVDALLQESTELEVGEPDLDVLKNIPGIPDAVPSSEILQDDVFASNLDLARAYIEIDEYNEAKALLEGVVTEGSDEQVVEAKALIEQLKNL
ncbi:FimV/HubP family polar landmark protein [Opacimonas viscosa]|uniref:Pilus assembly protein FimV n=1 Tax=Opacimonas viscosa TaxID=2961944 RepID=A0AA41WX98_9ALTE|nr:FimV/HubP family polar landmark protein [Opacimonas viscosa]MCP3428045.1 hypothetical protein [Opacimonas viscosa]